MFIVSACIRNYKAKSLFFEGLGDTFSILIHKTPVLY